jgi:prolyl 4-hydroxylase
MIIWLASYPKSGKTLIWPAEWTHAHYGSILKKNEKYIITGWIDIKV